VTHQLSPHFSLDDFERSSKAQSLGIDNRVPNMLLREALETAEMMERIREFLTTTAGKDVPVIVTSGYRCLPLNRAVGSSDTSDHVKMLAVDWRAPSFGTPYDVCKALSKVVDQLGIGQLIHEYPRGLPEAWVHTSSRKPDKPVNRVITITPKGTVVGVQP